MEGLHNFINDINGFIWTYIIIWALIGLGVFFTLRTKLVQLKMLPEMLRLTTEKSGRTSNGKEVSGFQALCVSTASRVGVGNIAGVAIAIVTGGPGAVFWMWLIAFIGASTGFVESTLAQIYKLPKRDGGFHGGPAYYIKNALNQPKVAKLFAILISVTFGLIYASVQANTITLSLVTAFGIPNHVVATALVIMTAVVISGGVRRIATFTSFLVPIMAGIYILASLYIIVVNIERVPAMFALIVHDAFTPQAAVGGGLGSVFMTGIRRGLFSNEAGEGSVPNAAATAGGKHPVRQGLIQSFGVYVDTWFICTATAFTILITSQYEIGGSITGIALAQQSFATVFGSVAPVILSVIVFLFAFSSIVGNYYYGEVNIPFFQGDESGESPSIIARNALAIYRAFVIFMVAFGCFAELSFVWDAADLFMGFLALTNLYAIARLGKYAFIALDDYIAQKKNGVEDPVFNPSILPDTRGIHAWGKE
ncbi:MAG: alanine:cation symporter family protein [Selenomonadaceae bacterium]|nr:alanine:cation symporter family protein [Selenomonadaceae bacterium]